MFFLCISRVADAAGIFAPSPCLPLHIAKLAQILEAQNHLKV